MKFILTTYISCLLCICTMAQIIPAPLAVQQGSGFFQLDGNTKLVADNDASRRSLELFSQLVLERYKVKLSIVPKASGKYLQITQTEVNGPEGYSLVVNEDRINIKGSDKGVFYALQSLLQLIDGNTLQIKACTITDKPGFGYRGVMLDAARHFIALPEMKKIIDLMANYKLNRLQWHLTDDQGWRVEIKKYPKLTQIGAFRDSAIIGHYGDFKPLIYDGQRSGGFYSQAEIREIVKYAADRKITIIPEIELPGHSTAALAAYPELGCKDTTYNVPGYWGVHPNIYCPKEETFHFLEDVLTEVMELFPGEFIHIGGDEVPKDHWKVSPVAQALIKQHHLKDEHELQGYFVTRIEKFLNAHGRRLIGWDEILEGGVASSATIMSWHGDRGGISGARAGHDVIMTPNNYLYADRYQAKDKNTEPTALGGFISLERVYGYNPRPDALTPQEQQHILGVQTNMWTEYVTTHNKLEYMMFPRMLAVAEIAWSDKEQRNYDDFSMNRLPIHLQALERRGVFFRIPEAKITFGTNPANGRKTVAIIPFVAKSTVYYTVDNHKADQTGNVYDGVIDLPWANETPLQLNYIIVTPGGRASNMFTVDLPK